MSSDKQNFVGMLRASLFQNWDALAMTDYTTKKTLKYSEVAKEIAKYHILFEKAGLQRDEKVALVGRNTPDWAIVFLATVSYGAVIVPILQDFHPDDIHHIVNHSDAKLLFLSSNLWEDINEETLPFVNCIFSYSEKKCLYEAEGFKLRESTEKIEALLDQKFPSGFGGKALDEYVEREADDVIVINYTSGTTGFSKGVMQTDGNIMDNIYCAMDHKVAGPNVKILNSLPLAHSYGCTLDFMAQITNGSHITFLNKVPAPKTLFQAFKEVKPTVIFTVPLVIEKLYKAKVVPILEAHPNVLGSQALLDRLSPRIKEEITETLGGNFVQLVVGGAALNPEIEEFLHKIKFPIVAAYGMTECSPLISFTNHDTFAPKSAGKRLKCNTIKINSSDPENIPGEILVKGSNVTPGYFKNPEATRSVIDEEGWFHTGDMGTLDKEDNLFIKGRCKSMLLGPSGQNIYPEALEAKMNNLPYVGECLIFQKATKLVALIYPDFNAMDQHEVRKDQLDTIMEQNRQTYNNAVAAYEQISRIVLYPNEFEKTPKKSIKRYLYEKFTD